MNKIALKNGILLDGTEQMVPQEGKTILIQDHQIEAITDASTDTTGYETIDLQGQYVLPGLINMHVHLPGSGKPQKGQRDNAKLVKFLMSNPFTKKITYGLCASYAKRDLLSGVTTLRTVGGIQDFDTRIRDDINAGKRIGPRILASNEAISVPHGHMAGSVAYPATSTEDAIQYLHSLTKSKPDFIKLMITGGVLDAKEKGAPGEMKMPPEMIRACCDEAHRLGYIVAAHVESTEGVRIALENGVDSIEHGAALEEDMIPLFQKQNSFVCTTISPAIPFALFDQSLTKINDVQAYNGKMIFEGIVECSKKALENNIPVALGNDVCCPYVTHYDFWRELVYFTKFVGVSNQFALYTATLRNAQLAGISDITGSIEQGKEADLIVTQANPLEDLCALRNISHVMTRGNLISNPQIKKYNKCEEALDTLL